MMDGGSGNHQWLHRSTVIQALFEGANHHGYFLNVYTLTLCSAAPLTNDHVQQAITHLYRKVPSQRLCFRRRDGQLWACYMDQEDIDFQIVEGVDAVHMAEELGMHRYNVSEGPLWCARLLTNEKDPTSPRVELEKDFPYVRTLVLGNHHAMADGTTNSIVIDYFLQILNDVITGKDIDDSKKMGEYKGAEEIDELLNIQDRELEKDPAHLKLLLSEIQNMNPNKPEILQALPSIEGIAYKTSFLHTVFDRDTSKSFFDSCKCNGITVNSGAVAVLNVAMVEYMKRAGVKQHMFLLKIVNAINMRRYLPKDMASILGAQISFLDITIMTPSNWRDSFWDYAKQVHEEFYKGLESDPIAFLCLYRRVFYHSDSFQEAYSKPHGPEWDYIATTTGNLDNRIVTEGEHVRLGHLIRFATNAFEPIMQMYHSFRGRFCYSLNHSVHLISREEGEKLFELVIEIFRSLK